MERGLKSVNQQPAAIQWVAVSVSDVVVAGVKAYPLPAVKA